MLRYIETKIKLLQAGGQHLIASDDELHGP